MIPLSFRIICNFSRGTDGHAVVQSTNSQYEAPRDGVAPCIDFCGDCFCCWIAARRLYIASRRCRPGRDPCCNGVNVSYFSVNTWSRDSRMPSNSLSIALDKKMPRYDAGSSLSFPSPLYSGCISDDAHWSGYVLSRHTSLRWRNKSFRNWSPPSWIIRLEMPSGPVALSDNNLRMFEHSSSCANGTLRSASGFGHPPHAAT